MDRPTKPSGRHAVRLRWDEIITRLSYRFNFLAILVGGIGVSGGSHEQDRQAASAALAGLGFEIDARA
jgi:hypothetical protein